MYIEVKFVKEEDTLQAIIDAESLQEAIENIKELFSIEDDIDIIKAWQSKVRDIYTYPQDPNTPPAVTRVYDVKGKEVGEKKTFLFLFEATTIDEAHEKANQALIGMDMEVISVSESKITNIVK